MTDTIHTYPTWHQFVRAADNTNDLNPNRQSSRKAGNSTEWTPQNWDETIHLATHGWPEGLRSIKQQVHIIERFISPKQPRKELAYSVRGPGILDFDKYQQGRPDAWVSWELRDQQDGRSTQIVPIVFNVAVSAGVSADTIFRKGAAVCALIDILEHSNIRVEVLLVKYNNYGRSGYHLWKVMLKHSEDVLDMDRMAFALCNVAVNRRLAWSLSEQHVPNLDLGYGHPCTYHEDGAINLDAASLYIRNEADMIPWLVKQLANYGIEVED